MGTGPDFASGAFGPWRLPKAAAVSLGRPGPAFQGCRGPSSVRTGQREPVPFGMESQSCQFSMNAHRGHLPGSRSRVRSHLCPDPSFHRHRWKCCPAGPGDSGLCPHPQSGCSPTSTRACPCTRGNPFNLYQKGGGEACHLIQNNQMTYGPESMHRSHAGNRTGGPVTGCHPAGIWLKSVLKGKSSIFLC